MSMSNKKTSIVSMMRWMFSAYVVDFVGVAWPLVFATVAVFVAVGYGIDSAPIAARFVFGASTFVLASACSAENIGRRSAERRLRRALEREDQWKTAATAAAEVAPEVVGRSLDQWFAAHGIGAEVEKSREAMENLGRFADSMVPRVKQ